MKGTHAIGIDIPSAEKNKYFTEQNSVATFSKMSATNVAPEKIFF